MISLKLHLNSVKFMNVFIISAPSELRQLILYINCRGFVKLKILTKYITH